MKRSQINRIIHETLAFFRAQGFALPPFAEYTPAHLMKLDADEKELLDLCLGWDITAFGGDDFEHTGLVMFTLRNGSRSNPDYPKNYAEKIMMVRENQVTPRHFHWHKREDIINRGGGNLVVELFRADPERNCLDKRHDFAVSVNARRHIMKSGDRAILRPGDSIYLEAIHAHRFYGEPGTGTVLVGEVSTVNNDSNDNCFVDGTPRFDVIIEDVAPEFLLAQDYNRIPIGSR